MARGQSDVSVHPSWNDYPELFAELDLSKNSNLKFRGKKITVFELKCGTDKILDWNCSSCSHEWKAMGSNRKKGTGCPACANREVHIDGRNSMAETHSKLATEYLGDATKIIAGTNKKLDWKCSNCSHEWVASGDKRVRGTGCPSCRNLSLNIDGRNSMSVTHPQLAKEYQGDATKIIIGTNAKLDWKCSDCGHEWEARGYNRAKRSQCPVCANRVVHIDGRNSMAKTHPELAKELQGDASKIVAGTHTKLHWKCSNCEHEWIAKGSERVQGSGCSGCAKFGYDGSAIGYIYIHYYDDGEKKWLKCGITNNPSQRYKSLRISAENLNIEMIELEIYMFDDGINAQLCEKELLSNKELRFDSGYEVDGKNEFFRYESLDEIKKLILNWL